MTQTELIPKRLDGKIADITGGSSGIGLATAQRFVEDGPTFLSQELFGIYGEHTSNEDEGFGGEVPGLPRSYTGGVQNIDRFKKV